MNANSKPPKGKPTTEVGDKPRREPILDLARFVDQPIRVQFVGHRQVRGVLKGYDQLMNLVMDDVIEELLDPETNQPREPAAEQALGLVVFRGPNIALLSPLDGAEEIANPFSLPDDQPSL